ncbi:MAG: hypothetical protein WKF34_02585 [Pyrinomonadaceae bacterium]
MKTRPNMRASGLNIILGFAALIFLIAPLAAQTTEGIALQRGYRTGYSDGYMAGYRDTIDSAGRDYKRHGEYSQADRAYSKDYGTREDYRDGYQQAFEIGYDTGYDRRSFDSALPLNIRKRGISRDTEQIATAEDSATVENSRPYTDPADSRQSIQISPKAEDSPPAASASSYQSNGNAIVVIPRDIDLIVELQEDLNTEQSHEGEKFTARVVSPSELAGATVEGRVSKISKPGRIKRRSEMLLSFDRIMLNDQRWSNFAATLTEVMAVKGDNIKRIDNEGTAVGQSSLKGDMVKVGGATAGGAVIGAVVGGPVGFAIGSGVGAAFGVGAVVIERGKHVRLSRNQQVRIRTSYETQIR